MRVHELKTWPEYFEPVWDQWKTFEIRYDDRAFQPADEVVLREFDPHADCVCLNRRHDSVALCAKYTGRFVTASIGHMTSSTPARGQQRGFRGDGYVVLSLVNVTRGEVGKDLGPQDASQTDPPAPSPVVGDVASLQAGRPATTSSTATGSTWGGAALPPSPASIAAAQRRARSHEVLERQHAAEQHIPVAAPRVAYSSGGDS